MMPGVTHFPAASIVLIPAGIVIAASDPIAVILPSSIRTAPRSIIPPSPSSTVALRMKTSSAGIALYVEG
jgi:hypothetical protein